MDNNKSQPLTVTALLDDKSGTITAFFNELPGLVVQAKSNDDVRGKLMSLLDSYIRRLNSMKGNLDIQTKSLA